MTSMPSAAPVGDSQTPRHPRPEVPLVVGVIGHRKLRPGDLDKLTEALRDELLRFKRAYPHTPIVVLTSLAQGADTLAVDAVHEAREILTREGDELCGFRVRAAIPMPEAAYRASTSFDDETHRRRFDELYAEADERFVVTMPNGFCAPPENDGRAWYVIATATAGRHRDMRRLAYANAGVYLVRHSDVLIALWDGKAPATASPSGTPEHVALRLDGLPPALLRDKYDEPLGAYSERGPVVVLYAAKEGDTTPSPHVGARDVKTPVRVKYDKDFGIMVGPPPSPTGGYSNGSVPLAKPDEGGSFVHWLGEELRWFPEGWRAAARWWREGADALARKARRKNPGGLATLSAPVETPEEAARLDQEAARQELEIFWRRCRALDDANREAKALAAHRPGECGGGREWRDNAPQFRGASAESIRRLLVVRSTMGALSRALDGKLVTLRRWVFLLLLLFVVAFHVFAHRLHDVEKGERAAAGSFLFVALTAVVAVLLMVAYAAATRIDGRRLEYRTLAEMLRIRFWWCLAGVGKSVAQAYPTPIRSEIAWIRQAVRNLAAPPSATWAAEFDLLSKPDRAARLAAVREGWVLDQVAQHYDNLQRNHRRSLLLRRGGLYLACLAFVLMAGLFYSLARPYAAGGHSMPVWFPWAALAAGVLPLAGGLAIGYSERRTHEELANQYTRAHQVFRNGDRELSARLAAGDLEGARMVCDALGVEALQENGQWLTIRRSKPIELHVA